MNRYYMAMKRRMLHDLAIENAMFDLDEARWAGDIAAALRIQTTLWMYRYRVRWYS